MASSPKHLLLLHISTSSLPNRRRLVFIVVTVVIIIVTCLHHHRHYRHVTIQSIVHRDYCILANYTVAKVYKTKEGEEMVGSALHTSIHFFHNIFQQVSTWDSSISISIFIEDNIEESIKFISYVLLCDQQVEGRVSAHFVWTRSQLSESCPSIQVVYPDCASYSRQQVIDRLTHLRSPISYGYPINLMRNVARKYAITDICILADIEMIFSSNSSSLITPIANRLIRSRRKIVFVIRRFEVSNCEIPSNSSDLLELYNSKKAIEFHSLLFARGHHIHGLDQWFHVSNNSSKVSAHKIDYVSPSWEPQVVIHRNDPYHDENIPTRHRDHQVLIYELCRMGYRFFVLSHVFNVHRGFKSEVTEFDRKMEMLGSSRERNASMMLSKRLNQWYPSTVASCGKWDQKSYHHRRR